MFLPLIWVFFMKLLTAATQTDLSLSSLPMLKQGDDKVTLRPATRDDYMFFVEGWPELKFQFEAPTEKNYVESRMPKTRIIHSQALKRDVGYITVTRQGSASLYINFFLFLSEFQRKGFGKATLNLIKQECMDKKLHSILLDCDESHEGVREFYKKNEFKDIGFSVHLIYTKSTKVNPGDDDKNPGNDGKVEKLKTMKSSQDSYREIEKSLGIYPDLFVTWTLGKDTIVNTWYNTNGLLVAATFIDPTRNVISVYLNEKKPLKSGVKQIIQELVGEMDKVDVFVNTESFDQYIGKETVFCERFILMEYKFSS